MVPVTFRPIDGGRLRRPHNSAPRPLAVRRPYTTGAFVRHAEERLAVILLASSMDQYGDLGMCEYLDRLAAEDERGDAVAAMRGHDDKVTAFRCHQRRELHPKPTV
jgi:hypothetical protein